MLVDHGDGEHEAEGVSFLDEGSFKTFHGSGADANALADDQIEPGLDFSTAGLGLEELDFSIGYGKRCTRVANDAQRAGGAENDAALVVTDADEEI